MTVLAARSRELGARTDAQVLAVVDAAGLAGIEPAHLFARAGLDPRRGRRSVARLVARGRVVRSSARGRCFSAAATPTSPLRLPPGTRATLPGPAGDQGVALAELMALQGLDPHACWVRMQQLGLVRWSVPPGGGAVPTPGTPRLSDYRWLDEGNRLVDPSQAPMILRRAIRQCQAPERAARAAPRRAGHAQRTPSSPTPGRWARFRDWLQAPP